LGGTRQNTERKRLSKGDSLPEDHIRRDLSEYGKKAAEEGVPTNWRPHRQGLVRKQKENDKSRGTHSLETATGRKSGHRKKAAKRGALTNWRRHWEGLVRIWKESD